MNSHFPHWHLFPLSCIRHFRYLIAISFISVHLRLWESAKNEADRSIAHQPDSTVLQLVKCPQSRSCFCLLNIACMFILDEILMFLFYCLPICFYWILEFPHGHSVSWPHHSRYIQHLLWDLYPIIHNTSYIYYEKYTLSFLSNEISSHLTF